MHNRLVPPQFVSDDNALLTGVTPGSVAPYIIIAVRDPLGFRRDAAEVISEHFESRHLVANTGMFITYTGEYHGVPMTVCSTGSGAPDTEIAFAELAGAVREAVPTFLRIGTSGSAAAGVSVGDLVVTTAAVRSEATTRAYVPSEYPAVASFEVVAALADAAINAKAPYHLGITRSTDSIYAGQGRPVLGFEPPGLEHVPSMWANVKVLNYERETSLILTLAAVLGYRSGSVCSVVNSAVDGRLDPGAGVDNAIRVGLDALALLHARDAVAAASGYATWAPSLGERTV